MADELDPRARALLAAYRRDAGPSPAATERLLASVRRSAAAEARVVPLRPRSSSRSWLGVAVVGLVAAALALAFKLSPRRLDADADAARSAAALQSADEAASTSVTSRVRQGAGGAPIDVVPEQAADAGPPLQRPGANDGGDGATATAGDANRGASRTPARPAGAQGRGPGATANTPSARGPGGTAGAANGASADTGGAATNAGAAAPGPTNAAGGSGDALAEELAIVRAVNDALAGGSPEQALARLDDYHRRFPAGALREEAAALRAVALCAGGRADGARAAAAFLHAHPGSLSAERVRRSCDVR